MAICLGHLRDLILAGRKGESFGTEIFLNTNWPEMLNRFMAYYRLRVNYLIQAIENKIYIRDID